MASQSNCSVSGSGSGSVSGVGSSSIPHELHAFVSYLREQQIECVVFDLDRTLVSQHSGGCVPAASLASFAASATPAVRLLLPHLVEQGFRIAIATFADALYSQYQRGSVAGEELVRRVLRELPCFAKGEEGAKRLAEVPIVTLNPDLYRGYAMNAAAAEEQRRMHSVGDGSAASGPRNHLQQFFLTKVAEFGIDPDHACWEEVSAFPPQSFKNQHLQLIAARLGLPLRALVLLDDRDENVHAAVEAGAHGLFLQHPKRGLLLSDLRISNIQPPAVASSDASNSSAAAAATTTATSGTTSQI